MAYRHISCNVDGCYKSEVLNFFDQKFGRKKVEMAQFVYKIFRLNEIGDHKSMYEFNLILV